jgi:hypothetical protein
MSIHDRVRIFEWFSWSHWGMFREPLLTCPAWFAMGMTDVDDDDAEYLPDSSPIREDGK